MKRLRYLVAAAATISLLLVWGCEQPTKTNTEAPAVTKSITVGAQTGALTAGTAGTATFAVTTSNIADAQAVTVEWVTSVAGTTTGTLPTGISVAAVAVASGKATLSVSAASTTTAGSYFFKVTADGTKSSVVTLTVGAPTFSVSFDLNYSGATGAPTSQSVTSGSTATAPTAPARTDSTFLGWFTDQTGTTAYSFTTPVTAGVTLYAGWQKTVSIIASTPAGIANYAYWTTKTSLQTYVTNGWSAELVIKIKNNHATADRGGWGVGNLTDSNSNSNLYGGRSNVTVQGITTPSPLAVGTEGTVKYKLSTILAAMTMEYITSNLYNDCVITQVDVVYSPK